jgi:thymidylate synthase (FAD)
MINQIKCLDKGYVKLLNLSGPVRRIWEEDEDSEDFAYYDAHDTDPACTARISFDNLDEERTVEQDLKLYEYLMKHKHTTPVEMIEVWLEMKLPIFLARQFVRHRTACINEVSARYTQLTAEWYIPEIVGGKSTNGAKQGQEDNLSKEATTWFHNHLIAVCRNSYEAYKIALEVGVAPEHARLFLHVNHYTHWVWKQDLHNLMHFLSLRLDSHAQVEARVYAQAIYDLLKQFLPKSMELFDTYRRL